MADAPVSPYNAPDAEAFTHWSLSITRDRGGDFWRWPKAEAWKPKVGGWMLRVGWRWTAWAFSVGRLGMTRSDGDAVIERNRHA